MKLYDRTPKDSETWIVQHVGYACNSDCSFCIVRHKMDRGAPSTEDLINDMSLIPQGAERHYFTGGEPTLRDDLPTLIGYARKKAKEVWLQTNGRRFSDKDYAKCLGKEIDGAIVSFHAADEKHSKTITRRDGAFQETVEGIHNLLEAGARVETNTVVTKYNIERIADITNFIEHEFDGGVKVRLAYAAFNPENATHHFVSLLEAGNAIENVIRNRREPIEVENVPLCVIDLRHYNSNFIDGHRIRVLVNGKLLPIKDQRKYTKTCESCASSKACQGLHIHYDRNVWPERGEAITFGGFSDYEAYKIFHLTKEEKRNNIKSYRWAEKIGDDLIRKIKDAAKFQDVKSEIDALIGEGKKNVKAEKYANAVESIPKNVSNNEYEIRLLAVAPSGFQHVMAHRKDEVHINVDEPDFIPTIMKNIRSMDFWKEKDPDYHKLFHVHFYHLWKENYGIGADPANFDSELMNSYEECNAGVKRICQ